MSEYDQARFPRGAPDALRTRPMADGRAWTLHPLTLGRLRITIQEDQYSMGEHW